MDKESEDLNGEIKNILYKSNLSFDETRAFFDGLQYLPNEDKKEFIQILNEDPELIYPLYINFKAKLAVLEDNPDGKTWEEVVEEEVNRLDDYLKNKGMNNAS